MTEVVDVTRLQKGRYLIEGKFAYLPEIYNKFLLGKLDLLNIELIKATLDSLDKENLVKGTYYNVTGTKYVQKSELSALFSLHFNEM